MPVVISEIVTEVVLSPTTPPDAVAPVGAGLADDAMDAVVRRATERVLEVLRREWDR